LASTGYETYPKCPLTGWPPIEQVVDCKHIQAASEYADAIHMAAQLGRLDYLTAVLAALTIVLALGAIGWGAIVWWRASYLAKTTAEEETEKHVKDYIQSTDGELVLRKAVFEYLEENGDLLDTSKAASGFTQELMNMLDKEDDQNG
jgi:hypothetical protein